MKIGFTGTRSGMTDKQHRELIFRVGELVGLMDSDEELVFIHGGCIGADQQFHEMAKWIEADYKLGSRIEVFPGHPKDHPEDTTYRGDYEDADVIHNPRPHLMRNRRIVKEADIMIATPYSMKEQQGGTWYTINYAKKTNVEIIVIHP